MESLLEELNQDTNLTQPEERNHTLSFETFAWHLIPRQMIKQNNRVSDKVLIQHFSTHILTLDLSFTRHGGWPMFQDTTGLYTSRPPSSLSSTIRVRDVSLRLYCPDMDNAMLMQRNTNPTTTLPCWQKTHTLWQLPKLERRSLTAAKTSRCWICVIVRTEGTPCREGYGFWDWSRISYSKSVRFFV